ncbi:MAG: hypothetical protein ACREEM_50610 [Blastocatellia bacterium]
MPIQIAQTASDFSPVRRFRQQVYPLLGARKDVLFEVMDAVIQTPHARSFAELSLAPACTRKWPSLYKALDLPATALPDVALREVAEGARAASPKELLEELCAEQLPTDQVAQLAIDVTGLRRMRSPTLKDRRFCHGAAREVGGTGVIIGLPYSIAAWIPRRGGSFAPPLHCQRLRPDETAVAAAVAQVCWLGYVLPSGLDWRAALDGAYGNRKFFAPLQGKAVQVVARTRDDRVLYWRADPKAAGSPGRQPVFGAEFRFRDESTWGRRMKCSALPIPGTGRSNCNSGAIWGCAARASSWPAMCCARGFIWNGKSRPKCIGIRPGTASRSSRSARGTGTRRSCIAGASSRPTAFGKSGCMRSCPKCSRPNAVITGNC